MRFRELALHGVWLVEPEPVADRRGAFWRTFCEHEMALHGLETRFVQHSQSHSTRAGTLRGMHFQAAPHAETKLVSCVRGAIHDVVVDLRPASETYRRWVAAELSDANRRALYIPKGCAHGFMTLQPDAVVNYLISDWYEPTAATGIRYDDPAIGIEWPGQPTEISDRDLAWTLLGEMA